MNDRKRTSLAQTTADRQTRQKTAHVIVCGNEKGGSGKTTTSMHIVAHLMKLGFEVATIDLDTRQQSLTRYVQNRLNWALTSGVDIALPSHYRFEPSQIDSAKQRDARDYSFFLEAVREVEDKHDFVVVDTPGSDSYLMRLAHTMADTLITPMNDSFVDFDVLGRVDPATFEVEEPSHYAKMVRDARRQRYLVDDGLLDWIVVRNRLSPLLSRNQEKLMACVQMLSMQLGFRVANGISERVIFREYFPMGLTALDDLHKSGIETDARKMRSHLAAREEIENLVKALRLPLEKADHDRAAARRLWMAQSADRTRIEIATADCR